MGGAGTRRSRWKGGPAARTALAVRTLRKRKEGRGESGRPKEENHSAGRRETATMAMRPPKSKFRTSRAPADADTAAGEKVERRGRSLWAQDVKEKKKSQRIGCEREK